MRNLKNVFLSLRKKTGHKFVNLKTNFKKFSIKFKENFKKVKQQPKSKRKSLFLGFTTVIGIFGVTLLTPVLSAFAQELPKNTPNPGTAPAPAPGDLCPSPPRPKSEELVRGLIGAAGTICGLAVQTGSFAVGVACGIVVVVGILKVQGK